VVIVTKNSRNNRIVAGDYGQGNQEAVAKALEALECVLQVLLHWKK